MDPIKIIEKNHRTYYKYICIYDEDVHVVYYGIYPNYWETIVEAAMMLSQTGLGPKVYKINHDYMSIEMEKIFMFSHDKYEYDRLPDIDIIKKRIGKMVDKLHQQRYLHRCLKLCNIGYRFLPDEKWEPVIIDYDTMISFDKQHRFQYLIENDRKAWKGYWIKN